MDKLIELLTEHCRKHYGFKDDDDIEIDTDSVQFHLYHNAKRCFSIGVEKVISKEFGFIDWLVENNNTRLEERVKDLEEMLGCLMRKYKMLKVYKGDRLIYSLNKNDERIYNGSTITN